MRAQPPPHGPRELVRSQPEVPTRRPLRTPGCGDPLGHGSDPRSCHGHLACRDSNRKTENQCFCQYFFPQKILRSVKKQLFLRKMPERNGNVPLRSGTVGVSRDGHNPKRCMEVTGALPSPLCSGMVGESPEMDTTPRDA